LIAFAKLPEVTEAGSGGGRGLRGAWQHSQLRGGVLAQFCYVGAQVGVASFVIRFVQQAMPGTGERDAAAFLQWHLTAFLVGRIAGSVLMHRIPAARMLAIVAGLGVVAAAGAALGAGMTSVWMVVALGLCHSIQFPTIFALAIDGLGDDTKSGASLVVMSIVGGAIVPAVMGALSDSAGIQVAFIVPVLCYLAVLHFAVRGHRHTTGVAA
jgi:FHS family L-fucose permease-like MFS transporter